MLPLAWLCLGLSSFGCSSSHFAGSDAPKAAPVAAPVAAPATPQTGDAVPAPKTDTGQDGAKPPVATTGDCSASGAPLSYNIMMVFDNTGSQLQTDPGFVRRTGGQAFVDQFATYVGANPKANVYMGVLSFNRVSIRSAHGWLLMNTEHTAMIKDDILKATTDPDGDTAYTPVLQDADLYFKQINAQTGTSGARNYLIFLTDGLPNADRSPSAIAQAVDNLVNQDNVALIAIASGPDVPPEGEATVKGLALPAVGKTYPDLVGQYYRASTAGDLKNVWGSLQAKIASCSKT